LPPTGPTAADYDWLILLDSGDRPPQELEIKACDDADFVECAEPVATGRTTDSPSWFRISVPSRFNGVLKFESPETYPGMADLVHPIGAMHGRPPMRLLRRSSLSSLAALTGAEIDPQAAHLAVATVDCDGEPLQGLRLSIAGVASEPFYLDGETIVRDVEETGPDAAALFLNLDPVAHPSVRVKLDRAADGKRLPDLVLKLLPGVVTYAVAEPADR
jgi:hypothetical protein